MAGTLTAASAAVRRLAWLIVAVLVLAPPATTPATPTALSARPVVVVAANQSFNWAGYTQGSVEKGVTFHSISARWIVPKAKQRVRGEAEYSSSWIGIGGGCLDRGCTLFDATLIQAGVGHDVDSAGRPHYYAWWETIPGPLIEVDLAVNAGDQVRVEIAEDPALPEVWTITIANLSAGTSFALTLPYPSTYGTAEWVIETPLVISEDGAVTIGPMPALEVVRFDDAMANGAAAGLVAAEQMQLVNFDLSLIASPSLPDGDADGFNDCTYARSCPVPKRELR
jgi:hypothetical protein